MQVSWHLKESAPTGGLCPTTLLIVNMRNRRPEETPAVCTRLAYTVLRSLARGAADEKLHATVLCMHTLGHAYGTRILRLLLSTQLSSHLWA
mmetsp:Transcript_10929/g.23569  ORF Transcript_10929/g.23569 Transcript_10929/m.23569 type:complete len:92 (-) Transcript_10929:1313-1588(-)